MFLPTLLLFLVQTTASANVQITLQAAPPAAEKCTPYTEASKKIGETVCITGKIINVSESARSGTLFVNFCEDFRNCPFTAVIFPDNARKFPDIKKLQGQTVEVRGKVQEYRGQAEIILENADQIKAAATPPPAEKPKP